MNAMDHKTMNLVRLIQNYEIERQLKKEEQMENSQDIACQSTMGILGAAIAQLRVHFEASTENARIQAEEGRTEEAENSRKNARSYMIAIELCEANDRLCTWLENE